MVKPGYKTTEFWGTVGVQLAAFLNLTGAWDWASNWHAGVLGAVATSAYAFARGLTKHGSAA